VLELNLDFSGPRADGELFMSHKRILIFLYFLLFVFSGSVTMAEPNQDGPPQLSQKQIKELVAPIALYPDPLLAEVLAASTYPLDVVTAARFVQAHPKSDQIDQQNWDSSVKALAHYPEVLNKLNDNLQWTQSLGLAFLNQQKEVYASVQDLRKKAEKKGNLKNSSQQKIVDDNGVIQILPAQEETIYVPDYDTNVVYSSPVVVGGPSYAFSSGFYLGPWLSLGCNWWGGGAYFWGPYYWGSWGYPGFYGFGGYGYYPYYHYPYYGYYPYNHYPYYNHYYSNYYNHYYPYAYNHSNPWNYNPARGGPRPYIAHPGQPAPWAASNQGTFQGTRSTTGFTGSNPGMRGTTGSQGFTGGANSQHPSNMFGSTGSGRATNASFQPSSQNSGSSGMASFANYRGNSQAFHSNGGVYLPKGASGFNSGFNSGWNRSNGGGFTMNRGSGGLSGASGMSHGFVGSSFRGSSGGGGFSGFSGGGFHGFSGGGGGGFHGFSGGGGGFGGFHGGGGRR